MSHTASLKRTQTSLVFCRATNNTQYTISDRRLQASSWFSKQFAQLTIEQQKILWKFMRRGRVSTMKTLFASEVLPFFTQITASKPKRLEVGMRWWRQPEVLSLSAWIEQPMNNVKLNLEKRSLFRIANYGLYLNTAFSECHTSNLKISNTVLLVLEPYSWERVTLLK